MQYTIYVQPYESSLRLAAFIRDNLRNLNTAGIRVNMRYIPKKASQSDLQELSTRGITRLPAVVVGKEIHVGYDSIVGFLTKPAPRGPSRVMRRAPPPDALEDFMNREATRGDQEDDENDNASTDIQKKMRAQLDERDPSKPKTPRPTYVQNMETPRDNVRAMTPMHDDDDILEAYMQREATGHS